MRRDAKMNKLLNKIILAVLYLITGSTVFLINITFASAIGQPALIVLRLVIILILGFACYILHRKGEAGQRDVIFSFLAASAALTVVGFLDAGKFGITGDTPREIALLKFFESAVIVAVLLILLRVARYDYKSVYISRGRLLPGLIIGVLSFAGMSVLAVTIPGNEKSLDIITAYLPWILVFIFSNAFMEELLFRGIFLKRMNGLIGAPLAVLVTGIVFALAHMQVTYQSPSEIAGFVLTVFVLAILWGTAMHKTDSLLAPVLFHAGADLVIIIDIFKSSGLI